MIMLKDLQTEGLFVCYTYNMNDEKTKILHDTLEKDDLNGVSFYESKQKLLSLGYSESEISIAVAQLPFDGKKNEPKRAPDTSPYENDLNTTNKIGIELLTMDAERQQQKTRANAIMSGIQLPGGGSINPVSIQGGVSLADNLGIPIFKILFIGIFIAAILYGLYENHIIESSVIFVFLYAYSIGYVLLSAVVLLISELRLVKMKTGRDKKRRILSLVQIAITTIITITLVGNLLRFF